MIEAMSLSAIAEIVGGQLNELPADGPLVTGVSIDTRTLKQGDLFIAIKGPRFDGHDYLAQAQVQAQALVPVLAPAPVRAQVLVRAQVPARVLLPARTFVPRKEGRDLRPPRHHLP